MKENQIEKSPLYLEKLLKLSTLKSSVGQSYNLLQRGTIENHNRLIRRWLAKGIKKTTPKEVSFIKNWINIYPKKCLNYKSPREFLLAG